MDTRKLRNVLILEIKTVSATENLGEQPERVRNEWIRRTGFMKNEEEVSPEELYRERAAVYAEFGKIAAIGIGGFTRNTAGKVNFRVKTFADDNEEKLLRNFSQFLDGNFDSSILKLCAHHGKEFDFPCLVRRMLVNFVKLPAVLDVYDKKPWEIQHIDTLDLWKAGGKKSYVSLELLTALFGIDSSKENENGEITERAEVSTIYYQPQGQEKVRKLCENGVVATGQLFLCLNNMPKLDPENIILTD